MRRALTNVTFICIAMLVALATSVGYAECNRCIGQRCPDSCQYDCGGFYGGIEYLFLKPRTSGLDFAIADPNTDDNIQGPIELLELDAKSGVRASFGRATASGWDFGFTYTSFESNAAKSVDAPTGGQLWLTRTNPASFNNAATAADANADLDYQVLDCHAARWVHPNDCTAIRLFGGPRAAWIDQAMEVEYTGGTVGGTRTQSQTTKMDGFGARFGGEGHWWMNDCVSFFGSAAGSVLVGDFEIRHIELEPGLSTGNVDTTTNYYDAVTGIDVAFGMQVTGRRLSLQTGYELTSWLNLDQRVNYVGTSTVALGNQAMTSRDLVLDGLFVRFILHR